MKMNKMNKQELLTSIKEYENLLNNAQKLKRYSDFSVGAFINHLAKLKNELLKRG